jgi:hypothetical protein
VRALLVVAVVALAAICGLYLLDRDTPGHATPRGATPGEPGKTPSGDTPAAKSVLPPVPGGLDGTPRSQDRLERFVTACIGLGPEAVPALLARLRADDDVKLQPRWKFAKGRPEGFPTLRSAYLAALAAIPGEEAANALRAVLAETASVEETYQIALALTERQDGGWADAALAKAGDEVSPATLPAQKALVALAAREAPVETAAQMVARAPRGEDGTDPAVLANALRDLPLDAATGASAQLLGDPSVTPRAKERYIRELCSRPDGELRVWEHLRDVASAADWPDTLRMSAAYAAAGAQSFLLDELAYNKARATGDTRAAETIKARFTRRLVAVQNLIQTATGIDLNDANDPRAAALRRTLERHRDRVK